MHPVDKFSTSDEYKVYVLLILVLHCRISLILENTVGILTKYISKLRGVF